MNLYTVHLQSVFDLEIGSWLLPKYLPLHPQFGPFYPHSELVMNIAGCGKIVSRCKNALSRLNKLKVDVLLDLHPSIRNIVFSLNKWMVGMNIFLRDLQKCIDCSEHIHTIIEKMKVHSETWNTRLYKKWQSKWGIIEPSSNESSYSDSSEYV